MLAPVVCVQVKLQEQTDYTENFPKAVCLGNFYFIEFIYREVCVLNRIGEYKSGIKDGIPIFLGYLAVSFAFGIQASAIGLTAFQAGVMSFTNLTSAGQFAALATVATGASYVEMAFTQFVLNLRYLLMSCALSQKLDEKAPFFHRFIIAFGVTDEIFGVSVCRDKALSPFYSYGLMSVAIPGWTLGTVLGVVSGNFLPQAVINALGIAIYGMFLAVIIPESKKDKKVLLVVLCSMLLSCCFYYLPYLKEISSGFRIIIITIVVSAAAALLFPRKEEQTDES